jgi:tetratricopeptide (TPR) repeat protein
MQGLRPYRKRIVASFCGALVALWFGLGAFAQDGGASATLEEAFRELADPENPDWESAQTRILDQWSRSGSPAFDLLLKRGRDAMAGGDLAAAIEHFTALTDQAPDFAEGWNARATAYYMAGLYGPSIVDIERVLSLEPRHFGAISGLGLMLEEIGNEEEAAHAYRESLAINPHQAGIRQALDALERDLSGTEL